MAIRLWSQYQLIASVDEVEHLATTFLTDNGWMVHVQRPGPDDRRLVAQKICGRLFGAQRAAWHITGNGTTTSVETRFSLAPPELLLVNTLLAACSLLIGAGILQYVPGPITVLAAIVYLAVSTQWFVTTGSDRLMSDFCKTAFDQTGYPVTSSLGICAASSAPWRYAQLTLFIGNCALMIPGMPWLRILPDLVLMMLVAIVLTALITTSHTADVRSYMPNVVAALVVGAYCLWPAIAELLTEVAAPLSLTITFCVAIIVIVLPYLGYTAAQVVKRSMEASDDTDVQHTATKRPEWHHRAIVVCVLLLWGIVVHAQAAAIIWAIRRWQHATYTVLDVCWALPLCTAYAVLAGKAVYDAVAFSRATRNVPEELIASVRRLATLAHVKAPSIAITRHTSSSVERGLFTGTVLHLSHTQLAVLNHEQRDALILHELFHVKKHSGIIGVLESLSAATLCGRGILSIIINPKDLEFAADEAAAQALGADGKRIVRSMLSQLAVVRFVTDQDDSTATTDAKPDAPRSSARHLANLLFSDGVGWYQHPPLEERLQALQESLACQA